MTGAEIVLVLLTVIAVALVVVVYSMALEMTCLRRRVENLEGVRARDSEEEPRRSDPKKLDHTLWSSAAAAQRAITVAHAQGTHRVGVRPNGRAIILRKETP